MTTPEASPVRRGLDAFYAACGWLAGASLVTIAVLVVLQIVARLLGVVVSSTAEFAGYAMAAASFLALAYTFNSGGHIRVGIVLDRLPPRHKLRLDALCLVVGSAIIWFFAWNSAVMTWQSYLFGDVGQGTIPVPLYFPQAVMTLGIVALGTAMVDNLVRLATGGEVAYAAAEAPSVV